MNNINTLAQPTSIRGQSCPNSLCPLFQKQNAQNILIHGQKYPRFKCKHCQKTWSANLHTKNYRLKKNIFQINNVMSLLEKGLSMREIAKHESLSPTTIQRWKNKFDL